MSQNINLKQKFQEYFNEQESFSLRSERFFEEYSSGQMNQQRMMQWLEAAFIQGARTMAQDTVDTLRDYGTAVAGVKSPQRTPTECYDAAADSLMVYFTRILQDAEDE
jgi:hypothetical protein